MGNLEITPDGQIREVETRNTCIDDFYDEDILTDEKCPECGAGIISHPDCTNSCSNKECFYGIVSGFLRKKVVPDDHNHDQNHNPDTQPERYFIAPRRDDARFKTDRKTFEVNKMWEVHKEIVRSLLLGKKNVDIAKELGVSEVMVSYTRNSKVVQSQLSLMTVARDADTIDLAREIREKAPKALELLEGIIDDKGETYAMSLAAKTAENWMDRAGYGAPKRVEALVAHLTAEDIEKIKESAVIDAESSSIIIKSGDLAEEGT